IGSADKIDSIVIQWPDLTKTSLYNLKVDSVYAINKKSALKLSPLTSHFSPLTLFDTAASPFEKHVEDDYVDFYFERNIPEMLSREGPRAATADVNGDGLTDIYIGGTKGYPGILYLQNANQHFIKSDQKIFYQFNDFEDGMSLFFDA